MWTFSLAMLAVDFAEYCQTGQSLKAANLYWSLCNNPCCDYGRTQTMLHILNDCLLIKFSAEHEGLPWPLKMQCMVREVMHILTD